MNATIYPLPHGSRFIVHAGAEPWFDGGDAESLTGWLEWLWQAMPATEVHLYHRCDIEEVYLTCYLDEAGQRPTPLAHYGFRGWAECRPGPTVYLFCDETETKDSLCWLLFHELTHVALRHSQFLLWYFAYLRDDAGIDADANPAERSDEEHERIPEEQFCNAVATRLMGGECYDRVWWSARNQARLQAA